MPEKQEKFPLGLSKLVHIWKNYVNMDKKKHGEKWLAGFTHKLVKKRHITLLVNITR